MFGKTSKVNVAQNTRYLLTVVSAIISRSQLLGPMPACMKVSDISKTKMNINKDEHKHYGVKLMVM